MKKLYTIFAIVLFAVAIPPNAKAQDTWDPSKKIQVIVGANVFWEAGIEYGKGGGSNSWWTYGVSAETRFTRHSGLELDIALRGENCLSIPIMYKFYSKIINFTAGFSVNFPLSNSDTNIKVAFLPVLRITKDIKIYKGLFIEPQIQICPAYAQSMILGGGVGIKYRF